MGSFFKSLFSKRIAIPNNFFKLIYWYYFLAILLISLLLITNKIIFFEIDYFITKILLTALFSFFAPISAQLTSLIISIFFYPTLIMAFALPFIYFLMIVYLLVTKKKIFVSKIFILLVCCSVILPFYFMPHILNYNIEEEHNIKNYISSHSQKVKIIFTTIFDQALMCDPDLINDRTIYDDKYWNDENREIGNQCRREVQKTIFIELFDFDQLKKHQQIIFVRLVDAQTIQILGLSGKIYQIKRCGTECPDPIYKLQRDSSLEELFLMLEGKRQFKSTYLEGWQAFLEDIIVYKNITSHFAYSGIVYVGYGEREIVVPVMDKDKILGAFIYIHAD